MVCVLIGNVLKPLVQSNLVPSGLKNSRLSDKCSYSKENLGIGLSNGSIFKWRLKWYYENS